MNRDLIERIYDQGTGTKFHGYNENPVKKKEYDLKLISTENYKNKDKPQVANMKNTQNKGFTSGFETKIKDANILKQPEFDNKVDKSALLKQKYVPRQREPNEPDIKINSQCLKSITGFETLHQLPPYVSRRETENPMIERFKSPHKKKGLMDDDSVNFGSTKKTFGLGAVTHTTISRPPTTTIINLRKKSEKEKKEETGHRNFGATEQDK